jgi:adenylyltransferase/sulfurtransferase
MGNSSGTNWINITSHELDVKLQKRMRGEDHFFLLDVRNPNEAEICSIPGTDLLVPLKSLLQNPEEFSLPHLETSIVVYCKSGIRSRQASEFLGKIGYTKIFHLAHGILDYIHKISPDLPVY